MMMMRRRRTLASGSLEEAACELSERRRARAARRSTALITAVCYQGSCTFSGSVWGWESNLQPEPKPRISFICLSDAAFPQNLLRNARTDANATDSPEKVPQLADAILSHPESPVADELQTTPNAHVCVFGGRRPRRRGQRGNICKGFGGESSF